MEDGNATGMDPPQNSPCDSVSSSSEVELAPVSRRIEWEFDSRDVFRTNLASWSNSTGHESGSTPLIHADITFKRFDVHLEPYIFPVQYDDYDDNLVNFRVCQETAHGLEYVDTYFELSGSRRFAWEEYYRGVDPVNVLLFNVCGAYILRYVNDVMADPSNDFGSGYVLLGNFFWWNGLKLIAELLMVRSFGILPSLIDPWARRFYYFALFSALCGLTVAYLQINDCVSWCFWLCWATFVGTCFSASRCQIFNYMGHTISDDLFFVYFLILALLAVCAENECMQQAVILLGISFGYAGPSGCWTRRCFRIRVLLMTLALCKSLPVLKPDLIQHSENPGRTESRFPALSLKLLFGLPQSCFCGLTACFDEIWDLFAGAGVGAVEEAKATAAGDWKFLLLFLLLFLFFALFFLSLPSGRRKRCKLKRCPKAHSSKRKRLLGRRKKQCSRKTPVSLSDLTLENVGAVYQKYYNNQK